MTTKRKIEIKQKPKIDLARALLKQHLFIAIAANVHKYCTVYKTYNGPIFAVFAAGGVVKRYIEGQGKLTDFYCSHDLRNTTGKQKKQLRKILRICFKYQYKEILSWIFLTADSLYKKENPPLHEREKTFYPTYKNKLFNDLITQKIRKKKFKNKKLS